MVVFVCLSVCELSVNEKMHKMFWIQVSDQDWNQEYSVSYRTYHMDHVMIKICYDIYIYIYIYIYREREREREGGGKSCDVVAILLNCDIAVSPKFNRVFKSVFGLKSWNHSSYRSISINAVLPFKKPEGWDDNEHRNQIRPTKLYIYIYIYIRGAYDKFPNFFRMCI